MKWTEFQKLNRMNLNKIDFNKFNLIVYHIYFNFTQLDYDKIKSTKSYNSKDTCKCIAESNKIDFMLISSLVEIIGTNRGKLISYIYNNYDKITISYETLKLVEQERNWYKNYWNEKR